MFKVTKFFFYNCCLITVFVLPDTYDTDGYNPEAPSITNTSRPMYRHRVHAQRPNLIGLTSGDMDLPPRGIMISLSYFTVLIVGKRDGVQLSSRMLDYHAQGPCLISSQTSKWQRKVENIRRDDDGFLTWVSGLSWVPYIFMKFPQSMYFSGNLFVSYSLFHLWFFWFI